MSKQIKKDFALWEPNITVSLWGAGKATAEKRDCPMESPPEANYQGDCGNCRMFMGVKFPDNMRGPPEWGALFKACCWAKVSKGGKP